MADSDDPPRKLYQLKPRDFERVNATPSSDTDAAPAAPGAPAEPGPIDVRDLARLAAQGQPLLSPRREPAPGRTDVHGVLQENLARANAAGLNDVDLTPRPPSRRKRDYWFCLVAGNAFIVGLVLRLGLNPMTVMFGFGGVIVFSVGLTWIMWFVMDRY